MLQICSNHWTEEVDVLVRECEQNVSTRNIFSFVRKGKLEIASSGSRLMAEAYMPRMRIFADEPTSRKCGQQEEVVEHLLIDCEHLRAGKIHCVWFGVKERWFLQKNIAGCILSYLWIFRQFRDDIHWGVQRTLAVKVIWQSME